MPSGSKSTSESAPPYIFWTGMVVSVGVFIIARQFVTNSMPFFAMLSVDAVTLLLIVNWVFRKRVFLWVMLSFIGVIHLLILCEISFPTQVKFGAAFSPLLMVDVLFGWGLIRAVSILLRNSDKGRE